MANRNAKLIERTLKDFSLGVMSGNGGTKVVTELPKVGEANTIYELHEDKPDDYPWCLTEIDTTAKYPTPFGCMIVVETLEDAQAMENPEARDVVFWVRSESKAYQCFVDKGGGWVEFDEVVPVNNVYNSQLGGFVILKDFNYHFTGNDKDYHLDGTGHFLDGSVFNYPTNSQGIIPLVLTNELDKKWALNDTVVAFSTCQNMNSESGLPTAKQAVDNNMCNIEGLVMYPIPIVLSQNINCTNLLETETYSWVPGFRQFIEKSTREQYTGSLEWETYPIAQINKIDLSIDFNKDDLYIFAPQSAHTEISYWIYSNSEWVNIDEIPVPSTSLGVTYSNFRLEHPNVPNVNEAVDIYYGEEKLEINDYYVYYPRTEEPEPTVAYATVSGLPQLTSETHLFKLVICPKLVVDTETDRLSISVNGRNVYESQWRQEIPPEITVLVEGIGQIEINVVQLPL